MKNKFDEVIKKINIALSINDTYKMKYYNKKNNECYFYSLDNKKYQIICISLKQIEQQNEKLIKIKNKLLKKYFKNNYSILNIIFSDEYGKLEIKNNYSKIKVTNDNWEKEIKSILPDLDFEQDFDIMSAINEQQNNKILDVNSPTFKKYNTFKHKMQLNNLPVFIFVLILTSIIPFFITMFWDFMGTDQINTNKFLMLFGGLNHDLLIGANQWWRIFSFPIVNRSFVYILMDLIFLFFSVRYAEVLIGSWKSLILLAFYPFIGILFSMVDYSNIISGSNIIIGLFLGVTIISVYKKHDYASLRAKFPIWLVIIFLLITSFFSGITNLIFVSFVIIIGCVYGLFINHNYEKKFTWYLIIPIIMIILLLLSIIILILFEEFSKNLPAYNDDVMYVMSKYKEWHLITNNSYNNMLNNYYHISM